MPISNLKQLFSHELADLYSVEKQILAALPKMISMATNQELIDGLTKHQAETEQHVERLEEITEHISFDKNFTCKGIQGIIEEAETGLKEISDPITKDAAIITAAQRVEHYEMAAYGGATAFAKALEMNEVADLLSQTLDEEKAADELLTTVAEGGWFSDGVNDQAT